MSNYFIRPPIKYDNIIWCNCTDEKDEMLESVQRQEAHIITGATINNNKTFVEYIIQYEKIYKVL